MADQQNVGQKVQAAVQGAVAKLEAATDVAVTAIEGKVNETIGKLAPAVAAVTAPFHAADQFLDDLIGGHNGGPSLDGAEFPADIRAAAGQPLVEPRPNAATAAAPQASKLGVPTGGLTSADLAKKPE